MFKKKLKELRMGNSSLENDQNHQNKYQPIKKVNIINNQKFPDNFTKRNLPELKLSKLKSKIALETDNESKEEGNNSLQKIKPLNNIRKPKSRSQMKNREVIFPKIKNVFPNVNQVDNKQTKNFPIHNLHNVHNIHNYNLSHNSHNIQPIPNTNNINNPINIHKIKNNLPINSNNKNIPQKKLNKIKKDNNDSYHTHSLISNISNNINLNNNNIQIQNTQNYQNQNLQNQTNQNQLNQISNISNITNSYQTQSNPQNQTLNSQTQSLNSQINQNSNSQNPQNQNSNSTTSPEMSEQMQELNIMTEKLNMLHSLFSSLSSLSNPNPFFKPKTINVTSEILTQQFPNFEEASYSSLSDFTINDKIKSYSSCTNKGNIRDYNEDTITTIKLTPNPNDSFYFFAIYDGHGGNGCSLFLKENLHKYITEFSKENLIKSIEESENCFIKNYSLDDKGEIKDQSGSCGIITMIKNNKILIGNVGDSRCVIFKKSKVHFYTNDHKPGIESENNRIIKAGGKIYQTPSFIPLFQNGKEIEIPWRVLPGRLSVSRTFGDVEAKDEKFGGMKNVVCAIPDIFEMEIDDDFSFIVLGCDGIFDVLSHDDLVECVKIVLKEKKDLDRNLICKECCEMIIKSALAKDSFDNVSVVFIDLNLEKVLE